MGCGLSQVVKPLDPIALHAPEPTQRGGAEGQKGGKAWERTKFAANSQWTAHSTNAVAKHAMAQGLPEPPESFFVAQERLVQFFYNQGEQKIFAPNELVMEAGTEISSIFLIEEGSVAMQKDVKVKRRTMTSTRGHRFAKSEGLAHSEIMAAKMADKNHYKGVSDDDEGDENAGNGGTPKYGGGTPRAPGWKPPDGIERKVQIEVPPPSADRDKDPSEAVVDTVQLTMLEEEELVGEVAFMEGSVLEERFVAGGEGCAMRVVPKEAFLAELRQDPQFAGNVFKNLALTLCVKCEEINWRLEEMATEASSMAWRASWHIDARSTHKQQYAVSASEAKKLRQLFEIPDDEDLNHSTTATFGYNSVRVHGHFLAFARHLCFYSRVFGMQVRKCVPTENLVSVLRDTPGTKGMENAIEIASLDETIILSSIPDIDETCEVVNEILAIAKRVARGSSIQRLELMQVQSMTPEGSMQSPSSHAPSVKVASHRSDAFAQDFTLHPEEWLAFLRDHAELQMYNANDVIIEQGSEAESLYFISSGSVRIEKTTSLGDGTVVISRLPEQSVFGEFFFLMGVRVFSLTSLICDENQTEIFVIKPSSVAEAAKTKPELPAQLYKYLAVSMARKYRVLAATAGYGLQRSDAGIDPVDVDEVFGNPVFLSFYSRYLRQERPEKLPWFQAYNEIEEFRVMPIGPEATARARALYAKYVAPGSPDSLEFLSNENRVIAAEAMEALAEEQGDVHVDPDVLNMTAEEIKEELRLHTYDKFVASSYFAGIHELKCREKEVPTADHFYFLQQLGVGSFGEVYAVRKKDSQRRYAMKVMAKASQAQMSKRWAMYIRIECDVMASLFHPSLVNLNYCFQTPEAVFMVLDLVVGGDLEGFQANFVKGPPTLQMINFMAAELVSGFEYMHSQSVIHRDMKPPNVLIGSDGHLRIADFGLSLKLKPGELLFDRTGTKPYMSPELHMASRSARRGYSFPADWYALGVTLYEICNGGLDLPPNVQHTLHGLKQHRRALPASFQFKDLRMEDFTGNMASLDNGSKSFLCDLLKADPAQRPDSRGIKKHKFFATVNWAALDARLVKVPWTPEQMAVLAAKELDENVAMRKTAKDTLQHVYEMDKLEPVSKFDFVSPRAVMEEYLENIYQLRSGDDRNII